METLNLIQMPATLSKQEKIELKTRTGYFSYSVETGEFWLSAPLKVLLQIPIEADFSFINFLSLLNENDQEQIHLLCENAPTLEENIIINSDITFINGQKSQITITLNNTVEEHLISGMILFTNQQSREQKQLTDTLIKYQAVMNEAADAILLVGEDGHILEGNKKAGELIQIDEGEFAHLNVDDIHPEDEVDLMLSLYQGFFWGEENLIDGKLLGRNGKLTPVQISGKKITIKKQEVIVVIYRDISKQKETEHALTQSENKYRSLFNESREGLILLDCGGTILQANAKFCEAVKRPHSALRTRPLEQFTQFDLPASPIDILASDQDRTTLKVEGYLLSKDGTKIPTGFSFSKFTNDPEIAYIVTAYDLSAVKEAEEERLTLQQQLFQAQKLEILGQLAGSLAHDFNNLLSPILLISETMQENMTKGSLEQRNLNNIYQAAIKARRLVARILDYTRPNDSSLHRINLEAELQEALHLFRSSIPSTIKLQTSIAPKTSFDVFADPDQINQIIMNAGTNAAQAIGEEKGTIEFKLEKVQLEETSPLVKKFEIADGAYAKLTIADTGPGLNEHILDQVFEPFFTTKAQTDGSGLGLSVVMRILLNHNGAVTLENGPDKGAILSIYLPLLDD